jgi:hypothetical protein
MIKTTCYALWAVAIVCASSGPLSAETAPSGLQTHSGASGNFSPALQLVKNSKPNGKACKRNDQCCSGNCQKATGAPKGTCLHGD